MALKVSNALNSLIFDEKTKQIADIKEFLKEKMDDSDEICSLLDDFISSTEKKPLKIKVTKSKNDSKRKKTTFYNHWLSKRLKSFAEEQKNVDADKKVGNKERMGVIKHEWAEFKESDDFEKEKAEWEQMTSSGSDNEKVKKPVVKKTKKKQKKVEKKSDTEDSDSD